MCERTNDKWKKICEYHPENDMSKHFINLLCVKHSRMYLSLSSKTHTHQPSGIQWIMAMQCGFFSYSRSWSTAQGIFFILKFTFYFAWLCCAAFFGRRVICFVVTQSRRARLYSPCVTIINILHDVYLPYSNQRLIDYTFFRLFFPNSHRESRKRNIFLKYN